MVTGGPKLVTQVFILFWTVLKTTWWVENLRWAKFIPIASNKEITVWEYVFLAWLEWTLSIISLIVHRIRAVFILLWKTYSTDCSFQWPCQYHAVYEYIRNSVPCSCHTVIVPCALTFKLIWNQLYEKHCGMDYNIPGVVCPLNKSLQIFNT